MNYSDNTTPLHVLLKELIDRSNYTVYQLAKVCDINRSTLQKAVSGQRPISRDNLDKLIPYLHLTVSEQKELQKSILISEIGEISYQKNIICFFIFHTLCYSKVLYFMILTDAFCPFPLNSF